MKYNKGVLFNIGYIITFTFIAISLIFGAILVQQIGVDIVSEVGDVSEEFELPSMNEESIEQLETDYNNLIMPYDLFFLVIWISAITTTLFSSFQANKQGVFSFFGSIFIGSLILLLITSFVASISDFFMVEVFNKLFDDVSVSLPVFNWYLTNLGLINFVWWLSLVLVNFIDRSFISRTGEIEE